MYWHIETDIIGLIAACFLLVYQIRLHPGNRSVSRVRSFTACLWVCVVTTLIDILASVVMEYPRNRFVYHLLMTMYFASVIQCILSWFYFAVSILYTDNPKAKRVVSFLTAVPYCAYFAVVVSNPWTGLIYSLDENMEYARGPLFMLMVVVFAAYTLALIALVLARRKHIPLRYSAHVLTLIPVILAVSIVAQLMNEGWLVILPAYMLCMLMAFLFLQSSEINERNLLMRHLSIEASTDKLTGALNRAGADARLRDALLEGAFDHCVVIIIDVDNLKAVNDTLGHSGGDRALIAVARKLLSHFSANDIVARYGGDEYVAFAFGHLSEKSILASLSKLSAELTEVPFDDHGNTVNASIGAAWGLATPSEVEELLHQADTALYNVKRNGKKGYSLYGAADAQ